MGKRGGGKFARRTVIQLEDDAKKPTAYGLGYKGDGDKPGASVLGGLIGQYGDSDDSRSDDEGQNEKYTEKGQIAMQAFVPASEPVQDPAAVSTMLAPPTDGNLTVAKQPNDSAKKNNDVDAKLQDFLAEIDALGGDKAPNGGANGDSLDGAPLAATPPEDEWETDTSAEEEAEAEPPPARPTEPTTSWQHCLDEGTQYYYYWNTASNEVTWEIPDGYSQYLLQYKEYEARLARFEKDFTEWQERQQNKPPPKKKRRRKKKIQTVPQASPPPPVAPLESNTQSHTEHEKPDPKRRKMDDEQSKLSKHKTKHKHKVKDAAENGDLDSELTIGPQMPPPPPKPIIGPVIPSNASKEAEKDDEDEKEACTDEQTADNVKKQEEDIDDDFIYRQLEEPVFECYTYVNKRYSAEQDLGEVNAQDTSLGIDIDSELENALALKQSQRQEEEKEKAEKGGVKRSMPPEMDALPDAKKAKQAEIHEDSFIDKTCLKEKVSVLAEAAELSQLVSDKLEFLEVNRSGLSKLQILLIEMQTRIGDWKCGGLSTDYLIKQLRAADLDLQCYEASAAPQGWACCWDRNYKRYFYSHVVSGLCQWEYPEPDYTVDQSRSENVQISQSKSGAESKAVSDRQSSFTRDVEGCIDLPSEPKRQEPAAVDFTSLAGAPPPPPPDAGGPPLPEQSELESDVSHSEQSASHAEQAVSQVEVHENSKDDEVLHDGHVNHPEPAVNHLEETPTPDKRGSHRGHTKHHGKHVSHPEEPPPPGTETEPLPEPSKAQGLSSLITYEESDSESDSRSDNSDSDKSRRSRRSSSSSSSDGRRRRRYSDSSETDDESTDRENDRAETKDQTGAIDDAKAENDLDGQPLEMENSTANVEYQNEAVENSSVGQLNVISKPAHFAAEPVLVRPPVPPADESPADPGLNSQEVLTQNNTATAEEKTKPSTKEGTKEKKKKKDKSLSGGGLAMKKKGVNSLVQKWQKVQKEVEKDKKHSKKPPPTDF